MKVLVVDDSIVFRSAIKSALLDSNQVASVKVASNGKIAIDMLRTGDFEAMTLDIEMPVMDGIETIKEIRKFNKNISIILFSSQNINAVNKTLRALELGADDFVSKVTGSGNVEESLKAIQEELIPKFTALIGRHKKRKVKKIQLHVQTDAVVLGQAKKFTTTSQAFSSDIVVIGSSTGGPDALKRIFSSLGAIDRPMLLVQHMPPVFTSQLAKALDLVSKVTVKEAVDGDLLMPGVCYLAPGDYHMFIEKVGVSYMIRLNQEEKVCFVRPAVDVLFHSVAKVFDGKIASFILTGMGADGAVGCKHVKDRNGFVCIQDEASSCVWGMPKSVYDSGHFDEVHDLEAIAAVIERVCP